MEYVKGTLITLGKILLLILFVIMVVLGHETSSISGLLQMIFGLGGILAILYLYNRKFAH